MEENNIIKSAKEILKDTDLEIIHQQFLNSINDKKLMDIVEYSLVVSSGYKGLVILSSGKTVRISPPPKSPEEVGNALKKMSDRVGELFNL